MTLVRALGRALLLATLSSFPVTTNGQTVPEFAVTATPDSLHVRGNSASSVHVSVLRAAALRYAPTRETRFELSIATSAPSSWSVITELALRIGMALEEGDVLVTRDRIAIRGTTRAAEDLGRLQDRLAAVGQPEMRLDSRVIEVSAERTPLSTFCRRQFYTLARNNRVRYVDRSGSLRSGAKAPLDRMIELLHDCPELHVDIVSRRQSAADAVASYLTNAGLTEARVRATTRPSETPDSPDAPQAPDRDVDFELFTP